MLAVEGVDGFHQLLFTFTMGELFTELLERVGVVAADAAHSGAFDFIQESLDLLPLLHVGVSGAVLLLLFPHGEVGGSGDEDGGTAGGDGMALVDVFRQLPGIGIQEVVDLFVVHRVHTGFLRLGNGGGLLHLLAVGCRGASRLVVVVTVHLLGPEGGGFIDGVIRGHGISSFL